MPGPPTTRSPDWGSSCDCRTGPGASGGKCCAHQSCCDGKASRRHPGSTSTTASQRAGKGHLAEPPDSSRGQTRGLVAQWWPLCLCRDRRTLSRDRLSRVPSRRAVRGRWRHRRRQPAAPLSIAQRARGSALFRRRARGDRRGARLSNSPRAESTRKTTLSPALRLSRCETRPPDAPDSQRRGGTHPRACRRHSRRARARRTACPARPRWRDVG